MTKEYINYTYLADGLRILIVDTVANAKSGHLGMPLGMADVATVLFHDFLRFNPKDSEWIARDRFILSAGHGSVLLYSLLFLTGYNNWKIEDLKTFRTLNSQAAGHPEKNHSRGIETTTGPLGQGIANAVGLALAAKILATHTKTTQLEYKVYVIVGDGCMMEGISYEAISLAGKLKLNNLVVLFDDNNISIDGLVTKVSCDNHIDFLRANNWHVRKINGHSYDEIYSSLTEAQNATMPSFIGCSTCIGKGAPISVGSAKIHGNSIDSHEIELMRKAINWSYKAFEFPDDFIKKWNNMWKRNHCSYDASMDLLKKLGLQSKLTTQYRAQHYTQIADQLMKYYAMDYKSQDQEPTRKSSQRVISYMYQIDQKLKQSLNYDTNFPILIGGSADLTESTCAKTNYQYDINTISDINYTANYLHYGVREHAMVAIMNGMSLSNYIRSYSGTFLVFTDYCIPAIRLAAMMEEPIILICTHDSIGVGEDGRTHQPIEQLSHLRAMPNVYVYRPCDFTETLECWALALKTQHGPSIIALTRQEVVQIREYRYDANLNFPTNLCSSGAYVIKSFTTDIKKKKYDIALYSSGSEVCIAIEAAKRIFSEYQLSCVVISVPSMEHFFMQNDEYRSKILNLAKRRIVIEAGLKQCWAEFLDFDACGNCINFIGLTTYGTSASADELYKYYRLTADRVLELVTNNYNIKKKYSSTHKNMI